MLGHWMSVLCNKGSHKITYETASGQCKSSWKTAYKLFLKTQQRLAIHMWPILGGYFVTFNDLKSRSNVVLYSRLVGLQEWLSVNIAWRSKKKKKKNSPTLPEYTAKFWWSISGKDTWSLIRFLFCANNEKIFISAATVITLNQA